MFVPFFVIFRQGNYLCGNMVEVKKYHSDKQKLHSFMTEASELSNGMFIYFSGRAKKVEADISIIRRHLSKRKIITKKWEKS